VWSLTFTIKNYSRPQRWQINKLPVKKMEELTLYLIDQQKVNQSQQERINQLKQQLETITQLLRKK
jgi:hypothetical protein